VFLAKLKMYRDDIALKKIGHFDKLRNLKKEEEF